MKRIKLTNCNRYALVDDEDAARVKRFGIWYLLQVGYAGTHAATNEKKIIVYLHRFIMYAKRGDPEIDHRNGDKLDCRKKNLRFATRRIQGINSRWGPLRGVHYWNIGRGQCHWQAYIKSHGKRIFLGTFLTKTKALKARKTAELKYFGELCPR